MKIQILTAIIVILAIGIAVAGTTLTSVNITVSNKSIADRLGEVRTSDYTCDVKICTYEITRAGKVDVRNFTASANNELGFKQDVQEYYEDIISKIKSSEKITKPTTKEITTQ